MGFKRYGFGFESTVSTHAVLHKFGATSVHKDDNWLLLYRQEKTKPAQKVDLLIKYDSVAICLKFGDLEEKRVTNWAKKNQENLVESISPKKRGFSLTVLGGQEPEKVEGVKMGFWAAYSKASPGQPPLHPEPPAQVRIWSSDNLGGVLEA